jgi:long-chain acyl-CoA synthetase
MTNTTAKPFPVVPLATAHKLLTAPGSPFEMEEKIIRGIPTRVWKNLPPTLRDAFHISAAHGAKTFLVHEDERANYTAFGKAVARLAHELTAQGVVKGDRVAIIMRNVPEWPVAFYAATCIGAIATPLNAWWTGPELEYGLTDSGAKIAIVDSERLERIAEHLHNCPDLKRVYVARDLEDIAHPLIQKLETVIGPVNSWGDLPAQTLPDVVLEADDDATLFYTSGTTGKPKGALGTHRNMLSNIMASAFAMARSYVRRGEQVPMPDPNAPQKASLLSVPFFHATGCFAVMSPALFSGAKIVLMRKWDPEAAMQVIERERCTMAGGVPTIAWQLLEHPAREKYDLSSLETISYGGAPSAPELVRRIKEVFPKSSPGNGWGMTETSATFTSHIAEDYELRPDSCGPAVPVCDMKIVGADGQILGPNQIGELWGKGPNVVKGYWNKPEATAQTFVDGWVRTGDLAKIDEDGFCFIVDRAKDMLIRGGENIYCVEVENVLYQHPAVMDAALVPIPHKTLGEEPGAVVTLKPGTHADESELRAFVAERLAAFKVPVKVVFWTETLPRNANGKILKTELKKIFA